jgi:subtilisin family serine protease
MSGPVIAPAPRLHVARVALVAAWLLVVPAASSAKSGAPASGARVTAASAVDQKLDAPLRLAIERHEALAAAARSGHSATRPVERLFHPAIPFGRLHAGHGFEPEMDVFLEWEGGRAAGALAASGGRILLEEGHLVLARLPVSRIADLAASPGVRAMSASRRWSTALDSSRARTRTRDVHQGGGALPQPYTGSGVYVGVLDSGLDYTHPDFRLSPSDSRVHALFDYSQGTSGAECRPGQLDSLTCPQIDGTGGHGHGTHVMGIAAGNGALSSDYVGMAPQADLLFVKGMRDAQGGGGFEDADIVQGVAWMLNRALSAGKPIAVNLSLGSQLGAHDGTSLQEQFLSAFAGPGRIIVAAAGNSGGDPIHVSYAVTGTEYLNGYETGILMTSEAAIMDLWAPASSNIHVGVAAYLPDNLNNAIYVTTAAAPGQLVEQTATAGGQILGDVTIDARTLADPNNGARNVLIQIAKNPGGIEPGVLVWSVYTFGSGTFDMWMVTPSLFFPPGFPAGVPGWFRGADDSKTIGIPATARRLLCVGSHVSKTQWTDIDDTVRVQPNATLDVISGFSSRGPSRDGRTLPDFTAPGEAIISALSKDYPAARRFIAQNGGYQEQHGTSQAAPHITGIAALMLQRDPALTPENVRSILQQTATTAGVGNPNNTYGRGRVNAYAAVLATPDPLGCVLPLPNGEWIPCDQVANLPFALMAYPNPAPGQLRFGFTAPARADVDLAVYDVMGRRTRTLLRGTVDPGVQYVPWDGRDDRGRDAPGGVYFARLLSPTGNRTIRLVLRR